MTSNMIFYKGAFRPAVKVVEMKNAEKALLAAQKNGEESIKETIKEEVNNNEEKESVQEVVEVESIELTETAETPVLTVEEMKAKLDEAGVSYHHASGLPKLTELMIENGIV